MRTIFGKQLLLYIGTLIISFVLLGALLAQVIRGYFTDRQVDFLADSAERVAESLENQTDYGILDYIRLNSQIIQARQYLQANVVIIDTDYIVLGADTGGAISVGAHFYAGELEPLMNGTAENHSVVLYGNLNNLYHEPRLVVGHAIRINSLLIGAVLMSTSMAELEGAIDGMYHITFICLVLTALAACVPIYLSCRAITKPLRQMNEVAGIIAGGDFEKRIQVQSEDETGQLAQSFNHMAESLQAQEKIRRSFIANLSHDLRSPLTSMRGFLQAIDDGTVPPEKQPYYISIVKDETERLIKLSNDILDIHRIQESDIKPALSPININGLIRKTISLFEKQALDKRLKINCTFAHETDTVKADADMIQRVLYNLIDNAIKFTEEGTGVIQIETTTLPDGNKIRVCVQDNGRGMREEEQKRIFDRFYKGDASRGEDKRGSGLGLSIVKEFIRAHGESIDIESEPGKGSLFAFTLPLEKL
ncbi:MAG: cell wall metabolism sensor histidine kinase WalK [Clostridiales bacterium]|jgi:signal transduction histidine kinase|nr:cell wall metabolism sensor histidine kinase WalK [Clostridiales bacterium]